MEYNVLFVGWPDNNLKDIIPKPLQEKFGEYNILVATDYSDAAGQLSHAKNTLRNPIRALVFHRNFFLDSNENAGIIVKMAQGFLKNHKIRVINVIINDWDAARFNSIGYRIVMLNNWYQLYNTLVNDLN